MLSTRYAGGENTFKKSEGKNIVSSFLKQYNFLEVVNCETGQGSQRSPFFNVVDAGKILAAK